MEQLYTSEYSCMSFEAAHALAVFRWLPNSRFLTQALYQAEMLRYVQGIEQVGAQRLLADLQDFSFVIDVHLQAWSAEAIVERAYRAGLREAAFVVARDFIAQFSVEQTMDEPQGRKFNTRYFDNEATARDWLVLGAHSADLAWS